MPTSGKNVKTLIHMKGALIFTFGDEMSVGVLKLTHMADKQ